MLCFRQVHRQLGGGLQLCISAAAYLPPALQTAWEDLGVVVMQGYGATECGFASAQTPARHPLGTVGRPMAPVGLRLDPERSEILVAGPTVFGGYWHDPQATAEVLDPDGWYHTGDVGHLDARGELVLSGRLRNLIVLPNGFNVYPEDVENALRDSGLREAVVLETAPGRIEAVVVPPDSAGLAGRGSVPSGPARTPQEAVAVRQRIEAAVRQANRHLDAQQRISAWRLWPDADFPRTHTLKVRRDLVRAWVAVDGPIRVIEPGASGTSSDGDVPFDGDAPSDGDIAGGPTS